MNHLSSPWLAAVAVLPIFLSASGASANPDQPATKHAVGTTLATNDEGAPTGGAPAFTLRGGPGPAEKLMAGDLMFASYPNISWPLNLSTISATNVCIQNLRSTSATDVNVEMWVSKQIPTIGGTLTHTTVGTFYMGTIPAGTTRCADTGALPMSPPAPDVYWLTAAIYEGTGSGRILQQLYTNPTQGDFGGPFYAGNVYFMTPANYYVTNGGNNASIQVDRIVNKTATATGQLRLSLWASQSVPRWDNVENGYDVAIKGYAALNAGYSYNNVDTGSLAATQPPAGTYWMTVFLEELGTDGKWYYYCFYTFPNRQTFTGAAATPSADFTFAPSSPTVGQSVAFSDTSTGGPTSWTWNFGNGATSTTRNPTNTYSVAGTYSVSLTATNSGGSNTKTKSITVAAPSAPTITFFGANPPAVVSGQQTTLTWTSTGGTSASIDQGVGSVPTSGSRTITPVIGVPYTLTVTGSGGSTNATVTISAVPSSYAGTWILPSSARVSGQGAFWTTDLVVMNSGNNAASVNIKFLGHEGSGAAGPERVYSVSPRATLTFPDVLSMLFGETSDYGPILIRSSVSTLAVQGQTWTASPTGGSYGQSVPALGEAEMIGTTAKAIAGVRQDSSFRTNLVLANVKDTPVTVYVVLLLSDGTTSTSQVVNLGPYGFSQLNIANSFGVANIVGGSFLINCTTAGGQVAAYASVIDAATADPRTILAR